MQLERARDRAASELDRGRARLAPLTQQRGEARDAVRRFNAALGRVYDERVPARRAIQEFAQREGVTAVAREVAAHPDRFGNLRGSEVGPIRSPDRKQALQHAQQLSRASDEYLRKAAVTREHAGEYRRARTAVVQAEAKLRTLDAELGREPGAAQLKLQIREKLRPLQPQRRQEVNLRLSPSERLLLATTMAVGLAFAREQGHER